MEFDGAPSLFRTFMLKTRLGATSVFLSQELMGLPHSFVCLMVFHWKSSLMLDCQQYMMLYGIVNKWGESHCLKVTKNASSPITVSMSHMRVLGHSHQDKHQDCSQQSTFCSCTPTMSLGKNSVSDETFWNVLPCICRSLCHQSFAPCKEISSLQDILINQGQFLNLFVQFFWWDCIWYECIPLLSHWCRFYDEHLTGFPQRKTCISHPWWYHCIFLFSKLGSGSSTSSRWLLHVQCSHSTLHII